MRLSTSLLLLPALAAARYNNNFVYRQLTTAKPDYLAHLRPRTTPATTRDYLPYFRTTPSPVYDPRQNQALQRLSSYRQGLRRKEPYQTSHGEAPAVARPAIVRPLPPAVQPRPRPALHGSSEARSPNQIVRRQLSCTQDGFYLYLHFRRPFTGLVRAEDTRLSCVYVDGRRDPQAQHRIHVPTDSCGSRYHLTGNGTRQMLADVLLQHDPSIIQRSDRVFSLVCSFPSAKRKALNRQTALEKLSVKGPSEEVLSVNAPPPEDQVEFSGELRRSNGSPVRGILELGERLSYRFSCLPKAGLDCGVGECWGRDGQNLSRVQLSDPRGCSLHPDHWTHFQMTNSGERKVFTNTIWAWSFPGDESVLISCSLQTCEGAPCPRPSDCSAPYRPQQYRQAASRQSQPQATATFQVRGGGEGGGGAPSDEGHEDFGVVLSDSQETAGHLTLALILSSVTVLCGALALLLWRFWRSAKRRRAAVSSSATSSSGHYTYA